LWLCVVSSVGGAAQQGIPQRSDAQRVRVNATLMLCGSVSAPAAAAARSAAQRVRVNATLMLRGSVSAAASSATAQQQRLDVSKQHEPPRFVQPISGLDVPEGGQAVFEVVVSGKPLPDVAWFHEGRPIQHGPDFQVDARPPTC